MEHSFTRLINAAEAKAMFPECRGFCEKIDKVPTFIGWIDVDVQLPADDSKVLCVTRNSHGVPNIICGYYSSDIGRWVCGMNSNVTHWMPLPATQEV